MTDNVEFILRVGPDGAIEHRQRQFIKAVLKKYASGECRVVIGPTKRTLSQLRFLFGYLYPTIHRAALDAGIACTVNGLHAHYKNKFIPPKVEHALGEEVLADPTTTSMTKKDFAAFVNNILSDQTTIEILAAAGVYLDDVGQYERRTGTKVTAR